MKTDYDSICIYLFIQVRFIFVALSYTLNCLYSILRRKIKTSEILRNKSGEILWNSSAEVFCRILQFPRNEQHTVSIKNSLNIQTRIYVIYCMVSLIIFFFFLLFTAMRNFLEISKQSLTLPRLVYHTTLLYSHVTTSRKRFWDEKAKQTSIVMSML